MEPVLIIAGEVGMWRFLEAHLVAFIQASREALAAGVFPEDLKGDGVDSTAALDAIRQDIANVLKQYESTVQKAPTRERPADA